MCHPLPSDDTAAVPVYHGGQIQKSAPDRNIDNVVNKPCLIWLAYDCITKKIFYPTGWLKSASPNWQYWSYEQKSVPTTKRGSADLRKTLFQVMDVLIKTMLQDDSVYQFLDKKRAQGKPYYVYMTTGANKFLRIYYGQVKEYLSLLSDSE